MEKSYIKRKWIVKSVVFFLAAAALFWFTVAMYPSIFAGARAEWYERALLEARDDTVWSNTFDEVYDTLGGEPGAFTMLEFHSAFEEHLENQLFERVLMKQLPFFIAAGLLAAGGCRCLLRARKPGTAEVPHSGGAFAVSAQ